MGQIKVIDGIRETYRLKKINFSVSWFGFWRVNFSENPISDVEKLNFGFTDLFG
jgi:hypothetical protein